MATQSQHLRQSKIPRQVGGKTIYGTPLCKDLHLTEAKKYITDVHYCICTSSIGEKIQYSYSISNMSVNILASAGIIVNSERDLIEMCLF